MVSRLKALTNWTLEIIYDSVYARLLETIAWIVDKFVYLAEFYYKESIWGKATQRRSLIEKQWLLAYRAHRKRGASGYVKTSYTILTPDPLTPGEFIDETFTYSGPLTYPHDTVFIPKWSIITDQNKTLSVYTTEDRYYLKNTLIRHTTIDSALAVNLGNGIVGIPSTDHQIPIGSKIEISGTVNYDGEYILHSLTTTNRLAIVATYKLEFFPPISNAAKVQTGDILIPVKEGIPKTFKYIASGDINESLIIYSDSVDNDEIEVFVIDADDNILATVTILYEEDAGREPYLLDDLENYYCVLKTDPDFRYIELIFGDDSYYKKLTAGDNILVKYADTKGSDGDISETAVLTAIPNTLYDASGNEAEMSFTNDVAIDNGSDYESIDSIRHRARYLFGAGYRAGASPDWKVIIESYPKVYKAKTWTEYDLDNLSISPNQNIIYATAVTLDALGLTVQQETDLSLNYLKDKRDLTDVVKWVTLSIAHIKVIITGVVQDYPFPEIEQETTEILLNNYDILKRDFGPEYDVYESNMIDIISGNSKIIHHTVDIYHVEKSTFHNDLDSQVSGRKIIFSKTEEQTSFQDQWVLLVETSVQIWIRIKWDNEYLDPLQIGEYLFDDPNHKITGINGYTIVNGVIIPAENEVSYKLEDIFNDVAPAGHPNAGGTFGVFNPTDGDSNGYELMLMYKTKDGLGRYTNDIRMGYFYNITDIDEEEIYYNFEYEK